MKAKTLVELLTLSSSLYVLSKDTQLMDRLKEMADSGKTKINKAMEREQNEDGTDMDFLDQLIVKAGQAKEELEDRIEVAVATFYKKINVAHTDEIRSLSEKLTQAEKSIALMEARLNELDQKES